MSEIVLGIGSSHTPLLALSSDEWAQRADDDKKNPQLNLSDGRFVTYDQLLAEVGPRFADHATFDNFKRQDMKAQQSLNRLADEIEYAAPDIVVIIGDDQGELFKKNNMPAFAIFYGDELIMHPVLDRMENPPAWLKTAVTGYAMEKAHHFPGSPDFALQLINRLMDKGVDVCGAAKVEDPAVAGFGHAFGFVIQRLFRGRRIPVVPVLLNTYFPPNVVRPARCYDIGRLLGDAIREIGTDARVAIISSGGLSHFITHEELDRSLLEAIRKRDTDAMRTVPMAALNSGSSEILCWIMAAGTLEQLDSAWTEYVPVYRTPAGTGVGLAFAAWRQASAI